MMTKPDNETGAPRASSRRVLLLALLIGLAGGMLTAVLLTAIPRATTPVQTTTGKAVIGGPFTLTDGSGKRVTEKDFAGKPMLVFFGFTNCPDVCPAGLQVLAAALDRLGAEAQGITPIFVTVDPERDTPDLVGKYAKSFHPAIVGLSGTPDEVAGIIKAYRVYAKKSPDEANPGEYSVDHSSFFYLMDRKGEFSRHFLHSVDAEKLADELRAAIKGSPSAGI